MSAPVITSPTFELWAYPRNLAHCKGCKRPIVWRRTFKRDRPICFDDEPVALRTFIDDASHKLVEVVSVTNVHWRTCTAADKFRKALEERPTSTQGRFDL